ncbi:PadR family transcriptional regulator [Halocatena marina]|uniref:PadR family transcriptional regulator n=1 Tax=Halocatena marina TaxID=2934937 RepID=A0ABD5YZ64_9EURY
MVAHETHPCPEFGTFERDLLAILACEGPQYGLELKRTVEERWEITLSRSRLYKTVNALIERGLVEKGELTGRASHYAITESGERLLRAYATWIAESLGIDIFGTAISEEVKRCTEFTTDHGLAQPPPTGFALVLSVRTLAVR